MELAVRKIIHLGVVLGVLLMAGCSDRADDTAVIDAAKAGYETFASGDMAAWAETQAENVEWQVPQGFPYGGTYIGAQAVLDGVFAPINDLWPDFSVEPVEYRASGNTVYIRTKIRAGGVVSDSMHVAVIENGKYAKFQVYDDAGVMMSAAQQAHGNDLDNPDHASVAWQVAAYSSAAPAYIGDFASVIGGDGQVIKEGSNGWTCMSLNPRPFPETGWKDAHDAMPGCGDAEGMKWMQAAMSGTKPDMERDSFIWMLHGDVGEDNTRMGVLNEADSTPGEWIESGPHLMLMPKDPATIAKFSADFSTGAPYVMMPGSDYAHLMIPLEGYYDYQMETSPLSRQ